MRGIMKKTAYIVLLFIIFVWAQPPPEPAKFDGYMLGASLRQMDEASFLMADIPLIEARILLAKSLQFKYGGQMTWGLSSFFAEWNYAAGLLFYPFEENFAINTSARIGSAFLDNISATGAVGINIDFPSGGHKLISVELEYFYRHSRDLLDYINFPKKSGTENLNIDSGGIAIGVALRL